MVIESKQQPISIYLSYSQKDEVLKHEFEDYLVILQQTGLISGRVECQVQRGADWSQVIDSQLLSADLVLLLVNPSLLASGYCSGTEVHEMFERRKKGKSRVIPVILYHVNLKGYPFEAIQPLPMNGVPVSSWPDRNEAWRSIDQEIRHAIEYDSQQKGLRQP